MRIGLDFDDVIADTTPAMVAYERDRRNIDVSRSDCMVPGGPARFGADGYRRFVEETRRTEYSVTFEPLAGALEAIDSLARDHTLLMVTARQDSAFANTREWMRLRGLTSRFEEIVSSDGQPKSSVVDSLALDYFLDDLPQSFAEWRAKATPLPWDADYNRSHEIVPPVVRIASWLELETLAATARR